MEIDLLYNKIKSPPHLIGGMTIEEFEKWCRTDMYGNVGRLNKEDLENVYMVVSGYPELVEYEKTVLKLLSECENE